MGLAKSSLWILMTLMSLMIAAYALAFFSIPDVGDPAFKERFAKIPISARLHIIPAGIALLIGSFQFNPVLRRNLPGLHRNLGRTYVFMVLAGAMGGLLLAWHAPFDAATRIGFASLAVIWFFSVVMAFLSIRQGNVKHHQRWMIRSYALTLAAVTLRLQLGLFQGVMGLSFNESYAIVAWLSWVPNLIIADWFLVYRSQKLPLQNE